MHVPFSIADVWRVLEQHLGPGAPGAAPQAAVSAGPAEEEVFGGTSLRERPLATVLAVAVLRAGGQATKLPTWDDAVDRFAAELIGLEPALHTSPAKT